MIEKRYFIDCDDDGHWYIVDASKRTQWQMWFGSDAYDTGLVPDYAYAVGGAPNGVTFLHPVRAQ